MAQGRRFRRGQSYRGAAGQEQQQSAAHTGDGPSRTWSERTLALRTGYLGSPQAMVIHDGTGCGRGTRKGHEAKLCLHVDGQLRLDGLERDVHCEDESTCKSWPKPTHPADGGKGLSPLRIQAHEQGHNNATLLEPAKYVGIDLEQVHDTRIHVAIRALIRSSLCSQMWSGDAVWPH